MEQEEERFFRLTLEQLDEALSHLTPAQERRIRARYLDGRKTRLWRDCGKRRNSFQGLNRQENRSRNFEQKKNTVQDVCFPYGGILFAENIAVCPGTGQCQNQNIIVNAVDQ